MLYDHNTRTDQELFIEWKIGVRLGKISRGDISMFLEITGLTYDKFLHWYARMLDQDIDIWHFYDTP